MVRMGSGGWDGNIEIIMKAKLSGEKEVLKAFVFLGADGREGVVWQHGDMKGGKKRS